MKTKRITLHIQPLQAKSKIKLNRAEASNISYCKANKYLVKLRLKLASSSGTIYNGPHYRGVKQVRSLVTPLKLNY